MVALYYTSYQHLKLVCHLLYVSTWLTNIMANIPNGALQCKRFIQDFLSPLPEDINLSVWNSSFHTPYNKLQLLQVILHITTVGYDRLLTIIYCSEDRTAHVSDPISLSARLLLSMYVVKGNNLGYQ